MKDVKLYKHFVERLKDVGEIKRAWFTTYNLDIAFFEKYILSAILNDSPDNLRQPVHYENLSAYLASNEEELEPKKTASKNDESKFSKTEVKVFYDYRMLEGNVPKRTTVGLYPIEPKQVAKGNSYSFRGGVFHPKVILLETRNGEYWLMVSSANLTFGGWSRNREGFFFEKLNIKNFKLVGAFFSALITPMYAKEFMDNGLFNEFNRKRHETHPVNWEFVSSFHPKSLIAHLAGSQTENPLQVWSPYFSKDLKNLIAQLKQEGFSEIRVMPAKNENGKIGITQSDILQSTDIQIHQDRLPKEAHDSLVHAKIWLTPEKLAIGSWNMTHAALGLNNDSKNNIEAGIIYNLSGNEYQQILEAYQTISLENPLYSTEAELNEHEDHLPEDCYKLSMDVVLDWNKHEVGIEYPDFRTLGSAAYEGAKMRLPGLGERLLTDFRSTKSISIGDAYKYLLKDRLYTLLSKSGTVLFRGFLRETGLDNRPVNSFENLDDLFKGWVSERPESRSELHVFGSEGLLDEFEDLQFKQKSVAPSNAWFSTFYAFEAMLARIDEINKTEDREERKLKLKQIGYVIPGCFNELKTFLNKELNEHLTSKESHINPIYLWFKIEKANSIFNHFDSSLPRNSQIGQLGQLENFDLQNLLSRNKAVKHPKKLLKVWESFLVKTLERQS